jgi:hypothetical protein
MFNVCLNCYPVMLQRYDRLRLHERIGQLEITDASTARPNG